MITCFYVIIISTTYNLKWSWNTMANESKKDFNVMMNNNKDMPKIQIVEDEKIIKKYGGTKMFFAPPIYYDELMKKSTKGKTYNC